MAHTGRTLRSTAHEDGRLVLDLRETTIPDPGADEVVIRVEATPVSPSDLGSLLAAADPASATVDGGSTVLTLPRGALRPLAARIGKPLPVGNEGAGTVIAAGSAVKALEGRRVAAFGGGLYADYRLAKARDIVPLPDGASAADGAAFFVNPLTALGFVETARAGGHTAIVHTAAASTLGRILQRICLEDGIALVNIVRSDEQAAILREIGATHVIDSRAEDYRAQLDAAIAETGATVAFDAVGGGRLGGDIVAAMERVQLRGMDQYSLYGSTRFKQLYVYGMLDPAPLTLERHAYGFYWGVAGWILPGFLAQAGGETMARLIGRVAAGLTTTFRSDFAETIGLADLLRPETLQAASRKSTGGKYLVDPTRG